MTNETAGTSVTLQSYEQRHKRMHLPSVLPVATPLSLLIDPSSACNFRCTFCSTGNPEILEAVGIKPRIMAETLFDKLIEDIAAFPAPIKSIHLYKDGEPLMNPRLPDMIRQLKSRGLALHVEMTSNGSLLSREKADALLEAGLDAIRISVYGFDDDSYRGTTRRFGKFQTIVDNVTYLHQRKTALGRPFHIHCKIIDNGSMTAEQRQHFLDVFGPISDSNFIHPLYGNELKDETGTFSFVPDKTRQVCSEPFLKLAINSNGKVSACCQDWNHSLIVGDVSTTSLIDIWNGEALRDFRILQLEGRRHEVPVCQKCPYISRLPADNNLDEAAPQLLERYRPKVPA